MALDKDKVANMAAKAGVDVSTLEKILNLIQQYLPTLVQIILAIFGRPAPTPPPVHAEVVKPLQAAAAAAEQHHGGGSC